MEQRSVSPETLAAQALGEVEPVSGVYRSRTLRRAVSWGFCRCARPPPPFCGMLAALRGDGGEMVPWSAAG